MPLVSTRRTKLIVAAMSVALTHSALAADEPAGETVVETKRYTKPLEGPELDGPILPLDRKTPTPRLTDESAPDPGADLAFGAYQRGYYLTALQLALPRAESGDPAAQTLIATLYDRGLGVPRDMEKAAEWYRFAADAGNREGQFAYANMLLRGGGVEADKEAGAEYMKLAAQAGHPQAAFNLAQIITARRPTWAGYADALPWYEQAAQAGLADANYALANMHKAARGVAINDDAKALDYLRKAAQGGLDTAQLDLGTWLANGRSTTADPRAAFLWFARAAGQGNVLAQNRLARMYDAGFGVKRDPVLAGAWHIIAKRAGLADTAMDRRFAAMSDIDRERALETAKRLGGG